MLTCSFRREKSTTPRGRPQGSYGGRRLVLANLDKLLAREENQTTMMGAEKSLSAHLDDFVADLDRRGRSGDYVRHVEECKALLNVAGPRRLVYLVALTTGLRRGEIEGLRWDDVDLDSDRPSARVRAATTKNRREVLVPVHGKLAGELRTVRPVVPPFRRSSAIMRIAAAAQTIVD